MLLNRVKDGFEELIQALFYCELFWVFLRISRIGLQWPIALAMLSIKFKWWLMFDPLWDRFHQCEAWVSGFNMGVAVGAMIATLSLYYRNR